MKQYEHPPMDYQVALPYILFHLCGLAIFVVPITRESIIAGIILYFVRMFAVEAGYHRYFSHKAFKTSRLFQFILAFLAESTLQLGVLWWADTHRHHHKDSDTPSDVHSPKFHGFFYAHVGWIFSKSSYQRSYDHVKDLKRFPELIWLDKHSHLPPIILAIIVFIFLGWSGLIISFFWSTLLINHVTYLVNSGLHQWGSQRYHTKDYSRNNAWLTLIVLGANWHNNHHHYASSARHGFFWWELDLTYYVLKILAVFHVVWDLKLPPVHILKSNLVDQKLRIEQPST